MARHWGWMIALLSLGCGGLEGEGSLPVETAPPAGSAALKGEGSASEQNAAAAQNAAPALKLVGQGFSHSDGTKFHLAVAALSCGYYVVAKGEEQVSHGGFDFSFDEPLVTGDPYSIFLWSDVDADGACDVAAGDSLWMFEVPEASGTDVLVLSPANLLPAAGWECVLFEEYGLP